MRLTAFFLFAQFIISSSAAEIEGVITEVSDGDSVTLANLRDTYKVRLVDIDAPELSQPYGKEARTSLREICLLKKARIETRGEDRFGRTFADVWCLDRHANHHQVQQGAAWVYRRYASKRSPPIAVEDEARRAKRGLWSDKDAMPPWLRRSTHQLQDVPQ